MDIMGRLCKKLLIMKVDIEIVILPQLNQCWHLVADEA